MRAVRALFLLVNIMKRIEGFNGEYRFLSNFFPLQVGHIREWDESFKTAEHFYQAEKFRHTNIEYWQKVIDAPTPGKAKKYAREGEDAGHAKPDFMKRKIQWMGYTLSKKFDLSNKIGSNLAIMLMATGEAELVELNNWGDRFWGKVTDELLESVGANHLGNLLMKRRETLNAHFSEMCYAKWLSAPTLFRTQFFNDYLKQQFTPLFESASQQLGIDIPNDYSGDKQ